MEGIMQGIVSRKIHHTRSYPILLMGTVFAALLAALVFTGKVAGQEGDWLVVHAEYGIRARHVDVTDVVRRLFWEARETGRVLVSNQNLGGDPVVGADKTLFIVAENRRHERQEFAFREGAWIDVTQFSLRRERRDDDDRIRDRDGRQDDTALRDQDDRDHDRDRRRDDDDRNRGQRLQVTRAYWGAQGQMVNVTDMIRGMVRNNSLHVRVDNASLGGDPAVGRDKVLIVLYTFDGKEQAASNHEGNAMNLP
jgi:hypothetical protein